MSSNKGANIDSQPDAEKEPVEKTTENRIFDMLERVMSIALQGFFAGSILGLVVENEPRKVTNIEQISSGEPSLVWRVFHNIVFLIAFSSFTYEQLHRYSTKRLLYLLPRKG